MTSRKNRAAAGTSSTLTRRHVLVGAAAGLATAGSIRRAQAADKLTMRLDWSTSGLHAPFYLAIERGWFTKAGIDLYMEDGNGSATTVALTGAGQFDLGHAALAPMALARAKGLPVISIAGFLRKGDTGIIVPKEKHWTRPSDLIGQSVAYTAGSLEGPFMNTFFEMNGVSPSQIKMVNVDLMTKQSIYVTGQVDAVVSTVPGYLPGVTGRRPSSGILFADFGLNLPGFGLVTNTTALAAKRDVLRRFTSIVCGAWTYILDGHEEEVCNIIKAQRPNVIYSIPVMIDQIHEFAPFFYTPATKGLPIGIQSAADWADIIKGMERAKAIPTGTKPADYFTNDLIDPAIETKTATGAA